MKKFTLDNTDYQIHDQMQAAIGSSLARRTASDQSARNPDLPPDGAAPHGLDHGRETVKLEMALGRPTLFLCVQAGATGQSPVRCA